MLLLYFVGHGVLSEHGELCLAIADTDYADPDATGLEYAKIKRMLHAGTPATTRIAILDCCFSGRAIGLGPAGEAQLADLSETWGAYTLTAADDFASSEGAPRTAFTSELLDLLTLGIPGGPPGLTLGAIFPLLRQRLAARGLPRPNQRSDDSAAAFVFARNAAPPAPGVSPDEQPLRERLRSPGGYPPQQPIQPSELTGPPPTHPVVYRLNPRQRVVSVLSLIFAFVSSSFMVIRRSVSPITTSLSGGVRYDAPRRKVIIVRITARMVTRFLIVLSAALSAVFLTGRLNQHFFQNVSQAIPFFVGGTIVTVFGRWVLEERKTDRSATADDKPNPLSGSRVFRIMVGEVSNLAALIRRMRIRHSGIALMMTVVVGLVMAMVVLFPRRAQPPVTSSRPPAVPLVTSPASPPAPAEKTMWDGVVSEIASSETGQCVEVRDLEKVENAIIDQGTCQGGADQMFKMISGVDSGTFKIQALRSGKCMTVTDDKRVVQVTCADSTQFWRFRWRDTKRGWNYWEIRNTAYGGGLCLDLPEYSHVPGAPLQARECKYNANNIANNQQWRTQE